jgi:hypothetical protein
MVGVGDAVAQVGRTAEHLLISPDENLARRNLVGRGLYELLETEYRECTAIPSPSSDEAIA